MQARLGRIRRGEGAREGSVVCAFLSLTLAGGAALRAQAPALYGAAGITPTAVRQGGFGSCYFHASLAALANADPELVRGLITQTGSEEYAVRFSQGKAENVEARDVEFARQNHYDISDGLWVAVLLRGYAQRQLRAALSAAIGQSGLPGASLLATAALESNDLVLASYDRAIRNAIDQSGKIEKGLLRSQLDKALASLSVGGGLRAQALGFLDQQGFLAALEQRIAEDSELFGAYKNVGQGGDPSKVLASFAGSAVRVAPGDRPKLLEILRLAHEKRAAAVMGTKPDGPAEAPSWWVPAHAYTVLDFDETAATVTLRNPWGRTPDPDGVFTVTLSGIASGPWESFHAATVR
jgi:hypothetical protein